MAVPFGCGLHLNASPRNSEGNRISVLVISKIELRLDITKISKCQCGSRKIEIPVSLFILVLSLFVISFRTITYITGYDCFPCCFHSYSATKGMSHKPCSLLKVLAVGSHHALKPHKQHGTCFLMTVCSPTLQHVAIASQQCRWHSSLFYLLRTSALP